MKNYNPSFNAIKKSGIDQKARFKREAQRIQPEFNIDGKIVTRKNSTVQRTMHKLPLELHTTRLVDELDRYEVDFL